MGGQVVEVGDSTGTARKIYIRRLCSMSWCDSSHSCH